MADLQGILPVLCTPFHEGGEIDFDSLDRLVDFVLACGVHGITVCGIASEAGKLTLDERRRVSERVFARVAGRVPIVVGASHESLDEAAKLVDHGAALGAAGFMVAPPAASKGIEAEIRHYYLHLASRACGRTVMIQDNAQSVGFPLPADLLLALSREAGNLACVKVESPPTGPKTTRLLTESGGAFRVFGGLGGQFFLEELSRGAAGCLPGAAFPDVHVAIFEAFRAGDRKGAARTYRAAMAVIRFVSQSVDWSHHCYKTLLWKGGILRSATVRPPTSGIDEIAIDELLGHANALDLAVLRH